MECRGRIDEEIILPNGVPERLPLGIPDYYGILNIVSLGMKKKPSEERVLQPKVYYERY